MRWANPSIATVSPSRTRPATASRIVATLDVLIGPAPRSAGGLDLVHRAGARCRLEDLAMLAGDDRHGLREDPQAGRHLGFVDGQRRRHPNAGLAALEDQETLLERLPLDLLGMLGGVELDADHQALAPDLPDQPRVPVADAVETGGGLRAPDRGVLDEAALEQLDRRE